MMVTQVLQTLLFVWFPLDDFDCDEWVGREIGGENVINVSSSPAILVIAFNFQFFGSFFLPKNISGRRERVVEPDSRLFSGCQVEVELYAPSICPLLRHRPTVISP